VDVRRSGWSTPFALALAFAALTVTVATGALLALDSALQPWFTAQADGGTARHVLGVLAALGDVGVAGFVLLGAAVWASAISHSARPALACAVAATGTVLTVVLLKAVTGRTAPGAGASDVLAGGRSYPSGHAATAAVCLTLTAFLLATALGERQRRGPVAVAGGLVVAVAWATVALGFHWVSDVVGGVLVGSAWATGVRPWLVTAPLTGTVGAAQRPGR
jgi:undecaprenyl-diphosphatase